MITDTLTWVIGSAIAGSLFLARFLGEGPGDTPKLLACTLAAFALYLAALLRLPDAPEPNPKYRWGIVLFAVLIHLAAFRGVPVGDTDPYRYHWDGMVLARGVNPYTFAPEDPALAHLRDASWERMDYRDVKTIYPPLAEGLLALTYFVDPTPRRVLVLAMLANLLCLWPLSHLLRARRLGPRWLAAYGWNAPLAVEFASGGHLDPLSVFFLLWCLVWLARGGRARAGALLALAVLSKTQMLVVAPIVLVHSRWRGAAAFAIVLVLGLAPFLGAGADLLTGTRAYLSYWEYNSGAYSLLEWALGPSWARAVGAFAVVSLVSWLTLSRSEPAASAGLSLTTLLVFSPAVFPWYLCWVLPFGVLYRSWTAVVAGGLLSLSHLYRYDADLGLWMRWPEYLALLAVGVAELAIRRRATRPRA